MAAADKDAFHARWAQLNSSLARSDHIVDSAQDDTMSHEDIDMLHDMLAKGEYHYEAHYLLRSVHHELVRVQWSVPLDMGAMTTAAALESEQRQQLEARIQTKLGQSLGDTFADIRARLVTAKQESSLTGQSFFTSNQYNFWISFPTRPRHTKS
jgi:hypothetical protein